MNNNTVFLAKIAFVDKMLDEFEDELGDLPKAIKIKEAAISDKQTKITESETYLHEIKVFVSAAKTTLIALKEKEDKLSQQQFLVRNNKEFDAISNEIKALKSEHEKLAAKMRTEGQKEVNLISILEDQKKDLSVSCDELKDLQVQFDDLLQEHNAEIKDFNETRKKLKEKIDEEVFNRYAAIRKRIPDAAVDVRRDSCMGCYRQIPQQVIVDMRTQLERIFQCEHCGRLLLPDWVQFEEENLLEE